MVDDYADYEEEPNPLGCLNCLNFFVYLGQAFVTVAMGQYGAFGFATIQQVSDLYPTLVSPPPWVSTTVIFVLIVALLIWATAQLFPDFRTRVRGGVKHYYVGVALCQFIWVIMFSYELIYISLFAACAILCFLGFLLWDQNKAVVLENMLDYWVLKFPFVMAFGWTIYVILWNLCMVLVYSKASINVQYWIALFSLVTMGLTSFATIFFAKAEYVIPSLMAFCTVRGCSIYPLLYLIHNLHIIFFIL